jgi:hypothetical protein
MRVKILIHCVGTLVSYMPGEVLDILGDDAWHVRASNTG